MALTLRERNRLAAREQVRRVAFEMMSERGFEAVTVEEIASGSDVSASTVYRYFGTKEALVLSTERPAKLVARLAKDTSTRTAVEAFQRAALKVWGGDPAVEVEIGLATANQPLLETFERQLLDQRCAVAELFAARRAKKSPVARDHALASAALAVLATALVSWQRNGGGDKALGKLFTKSFAVLSG